jgi:hypothetical protein
MSAAVAVVVVVVHKEYLVVVIGFTFLLCVHIARVASLLLNYNTNITM